MVDRAEMIPALKLYAPGPFEIRIIDGKEGGERVDLFSGFFDDVDAAANSIAKLSAWSGVYLTLNAINPALLARCHNRLARVGKRGGLTSDKDITRRRLLPIDIDAQRPAGISSTDAEHEAALELARRVVDYLSVNGWPEPIMADSGNGAHLLYLIDLPADDGELVKRTLAALAEQFDTDAVKVDLSVFNPARIWKLPGTLACKGDSTADRPHRMARIISAPARPTLVIADQLEHIAAQAKPVAIVAPRPAHASGGTFDAAAWMRRHEPDADGPHPYAGGQKWILPTCARDPSHTGGCAVVIQLPNGAMAYKCHHNSCAGWEWSDYRGSKEPDYRARSGKIAKTGISTRTDEPGEAIEDYGIDAATTTADAADVPVDDAPATTALAFEDAADLIRDYPEPRPYVLEGLLREREIMNFVSSSKVGKTWGMNDLALCITTGRAWLSRFAVVRGDVLYIDAELHRQTISYRLRAISRARGILPAEYAGHLKILSLRGRLRTIPELEPTIRAIEPGRFKVIFIDSLYRVWPAGMDENSNAHVTSVYNILDRWADLTGAAIICVHHASKGNQSSKAVADVGSGAGAQSRAADTHLVLRAHEQEDAAVLECVARSSPPLPPVGIRWKLPTWFVDPTLDVDRLREPGQKPAGQTWTAATFTDAVLNSSAMPKTLIISAAKARGMTFRDAETWFAKAQVEGLIEVQIDPDDSRKKVYGRHGGQNGK